jgi:hypothetical protein
MKRIVLFTLGFAGLTLLLTWLWLAGGNAHYGLTMQPIAREINEWMGLSGPGTMLRNRFINIVPFVALMLITPRLSFRRRFGGLVLGLLVLVASHLALNAMAVSLQATRHFPPTAALLSDAEPFILWFVLARDFIQESVKGIRNSSGSDARAEHIPNDRA